MIETADIYAQAALEALRDNRNLFSSEKIAAASCLITPDDRPAPNCGVLFLGVRPTIRVVKQVPARLYEEVQIIVAVTLRTTGVPTDRAGEARMSNKPDRSRFRLTLNEVKTEILRTLHASNDVLIRGQKLLVAYDSEQLPYPLLSPLTFVRGPSEGPQVVSSDHFGAFSDSSPEKGRIESGLLLKLFFSGGRRYRAWP